MTSNAALDRVLEQRFWVPHSADFVNSPEYRREGKRYEHDHVEVVKRATESPPGQRRQTVSGFTGWIHNLYDTKDRESEKLQGSADEKELEDKKYWIRHISGRASRDKKWTNIYNTLESSEVLRIPDLQINGLPLCGKPDLVFRSNYYGEILVIERKVHYGSQWYSPEVPIDGWPDLRAQLWAYGYCVSLLKQCDSVLKKGRGRIRLCADVWVKETYFKPLERRAVLNWASDDLDFDRQNRQLFDLYRSKSL